MSKLSKPRTNSPVCDHLHGEAQPYAHPGTLVNCLVMLARLLLAFACKEILFINPTLPQPCLPPIYSLSYTQKKKDKYKKRLASRLSLLPHTPNKYLPTHISHPLPLTGLSVTNQTKPNHKMGIQTTILQVSAAIGLYILYLTITSIRKRFGNARFARQHGCLPPSKAPVDWTFNISRPFVIAKIRKQHKFMPFTQAAFQRNGNTFATSVAGKRLIMTCEPENFKTILATSFKDFDLGKLRHDNWAEVLGNGIFTVDGAEWMHSRAMLRPQFEKSQIMDLDDLEKHTQNLLSRLSSGDGEVINLHEYFLNFTLDFSTGLLFGESVNSQLGHDTSAFAKDLDYAQRVISFRVSLENFWWVYRPKAFTQAVKNVHRFVDQSVQLAVDKAQQSNKEEKEGKYVFLEALARETRDPIVLRDQMMNVLVAGRDTTVFTTFLSLSLALAIWLTDRIQGRLPFLDLLLSGEKPQGLGYSETRDLE